MASFGDGKVFDKIKIKVEYLDGEGNLISRSGIAVKCNESEEQINTDLLKAFLALMNHHLNKLERTKKFLEKKQEEDSVSQAKT